MKKNILVLTGSARVGGNSDLMADAFIKGAITAGHEVVKCEAGRKTIKGCIACDKCFSNGTACIFNDDFNEIATYIEKADMIVFATPMYWYTFPSQLKGVIDKLYSFIVGEKKLNVTDCMLLVCGEDADVSNFDGIIRTYQIFTSYLKWADKGQLIIPGVFNKGDILSTDYLVRAEEMGNNIQ